MAVDEVVAWLRSASSDEERQSLARYGIPNADAFGVPMRELKKQAKTMGRSHELAADLWATGLYEARTMAAFIDEPDRVNSDQMDRWAHDFDSWAICDTVCFHLFDRTALAWDKVTEWSSAREEFVRRAAFALLWALALHDKNSADERFINALRIVVEAEPDERPMVNKSIDMALGAVARRSDALRRATLDTAERLALAPERGRSKTGKDVLRELARQERLQAESS